MLGLAFPILAYQLLTWLDTNVAFWCHLVQFIWLSQRTSVIIARNLRLTRSADINANTSAPIQYTERKSNLHSARSIKIVRLYTVPASCRYFQTFLWYILLGDCCQFTNNSIPLTRPSFIDTKSSLLIFYGVKVSNSLGTAHSLSFRTEKSNPRLTITITAATMNSECPLNGCVAISMKSQPM